MSDKIQSRGGIRQWGKGGGGRVSCGHVGRGAHQRAGHQHGHVVAPITQTAVQKAPGTGSGMAVEVKEWMGVGGRDPVAEKVGH